MQAGQPHLSLRELRQGGSEVELLGEGRAPFQEGALLCQGRLRAKVADLLQQLRQGAAQHGGVLRPLALRA